MTACYEDKNDQDGDAVEWNAGGPAVEAPEQLAALPRSHPGAAVHAVPWLQPGCVQAAPPLPQHPVQVTYTDLLDL